jgi:hypothetical protein
MEWMARHLMRRREFITLVGGAATGWSSAIWAQQNYQRFVPFLIDLPGWTALSPIGTKDDGEISAARSYSRHDAHFDAGIISGKAAFTSVIDTPEKYIDSTTIDGFQVTTIFAPSFGAITVTFGPNAWFSIRFDNVPKDEAMAIARKFDWKGMQALFN